eukprot:1991741-Pleurochrysis_carterae.AAC.2
MVPRSQSGPSSGSLSARNGECLGSDRPNLATRTRIGQAYTMVVSKTALGWDFANHFYTTLYSREGCVANFTDATIL